jgi:hypothetical protein
MLWSRSRLSHQLDRMEARGLVSREGCPTDGRGTFATLTPAGLTAIRDAAPAHVGSIRRNLLDLLSREQVDALAGITDAVVTHHAGQGCTGARFPCPGDALEGDCPPPCDAAEATERAMTAASGARVDDDRQRA